MKYGELLTDTDTHLTPQVNCYYVRVRMMFQNLTVFCQNIFEMPDDVPTTSLCSVQRRIGLCSQLQRSLRGLSNVTRRNGGRYPNAHGHAPLANVRKL